ncbi:hypothetical protein [Mesorhizobium sp. SARCC-RB16n]|uniref:hypothetical protein n=1 Tax=Mesorhizobium sp. SARCC-RB16n TaxID=2116687 RepID=UPI00122EC414|nr:hypothetical protein [Mesorhizobium sp. SARCC-RB16n]
MIAARFSRSTVFKLASDLSIASGDGRMRCAHLRKRAASSRVSSIPSATQLGARPKLALVVEVTDMARSYVLAADGVYGSDLRASFEDASARFAIPNHIRERGRSLGARAGKS